MELDELKQFLKIDGNDSDLILTSYQKAAESYLKNAGVKVSYENELYKVVVSIIVGTFVDNPELLGEKEINSTPINLTALIVQLRTAGVSV